MVDFFKDNLSIKSILEPSCGDGVFVEALLESQFFSQHKKGNRYRNRKKEAEKLSEKLKDNSNIDVVNGDFLSSIINIKIWTHMI